MESSALIGRFVGSIGSGAVALWLRSWSIFTINSSLPFTASRFSGVAGPFTTGWLTRPKMNPSLSAMCSAHSATDQRSGAGLKFHCAGDKPFVASRKTLREPSNSATALSRSACVSVSAETATAANKNNASHFFILVFSVFQVQVEPGLLNLNELGIQRFRVYVKTSGKAAYGIVQGRLNSDRGCVRRGRARA